MFLEQAVFSERCMRFQGRARVAGHGPQNQNFIKRSLLTSGLDKDVIHLEIM